MDPPSLMNESSFPSFNGAPYDFSEIWPFPVNGGGESSSGGRLELGRPPFAADISRFFGEAATAANPDPSGNDSMNGGGGSARRRRDADEEAAAKSVSTSSANNGSDRKRLKTSVSGDENQSSKPDDEGNSGKVVDQGSKSQTEPPKDYIHV